MKDSLLHHIYAVYSKLMKLYRRIQIPTIYSIGVCCSLYFCLAPVKNAAGLGVCVLLYVFTYISASTFPENFRNIVSYADRLWKKIILILLYIYFCVSVFGLVYLEPNTLNAFKFSPRLYLLFAVFWTIPLFFGFVRAIVLLLSDSLSSSKGLSLKTKLLLIGLLMANYGMWIYAFNPCITSPDSANLYNQAHQMFSVPMHNWHPPFYAMLMSWLLFLCDSIIFLVVVQCLAFSVLLVQIVDFLLSRGCKRFYVFILYSVLGFSFNNSMMMITLWKDIPYMISILWLSFLLAQFIISEYEVKRLWYIKFVLSMAFTVLFRQNGLFPVLAVSMILTVFSIFKKKKKLAISVAVSILLIMFVEGPLYSFYKIIDQPGGLKYYALANDIRGTYYEIDDPSEDMIKMVNEITNDNPEEYLYMAYYTIYNTNSLNDYSVTEFISLYADTFFRHPVILLRNFMRRNTLLWSVIKPEGELLSICYLGDYHDDDNYTYTYPSRTNNYLTGKITGFSEKLTDNSVIYLFSWRVGFYVLIMLGVMVFIFYKKGIMVLLPFIPNIFNILSLYVSSGWCDFRYYWPISILTFFLLAFSHIYYKQ